MALTAIVAGLIVLGLACRIEPTTAGAAVQLIEMVVTGFAVLVGGAIMLAVLQKRRLAVPCARCGKCNIPAKDVADGEDFYCSKCTAALEREKKAAAAEGGMPTAAAVFFCVFIALCAIVAASQGWFRYAALGLAAPYGCFWLSPLIAWVLRRVFRKAGSPAENGIALTRSFVALYCLVLFAGGAAAIFFLTPRGESFWAGFLTFAAAAVSVLAAFYLHLKYRWRTFRRAANKEMSAAPSVPPGEPSLVAPTGDEI
ncbi:MAG TPA: hypothetical protein VFE24_08960 [Pirellulales bacterium]|nr:hypothetical protein [Pirellulales bacterium]